MEFCVQWEQLVGLEPRAIVPEDLYTSWEILHAEQILLILDEEQVFAYRSESDGVVATDSVEHGLGAGEEGKQEEEVNHLKLI